MDHFSTANPRFLVIVVYSSEIGLAYVQEGRICDTTRFHLPRAMDNSDYNTSLLTGVWPRIQAYFDQVDEILAYPLVVHKTNLKEMLTYHGLELPGKKYVCVYYWARAVLGITSLKSLYELIGTPTVPTNSDHPLYQTEPVHQAERIARIALYLQNRQKSIAPLPKQVESTTTPVLTQSLTQQGVF